jgi:VanZ family protein
MIVPQDSPVGRQAERLVVSEAWNPVRREEIDIARYRGNLLAVYLIAVFGLTLTPLPESPEASGQIDKVVHFGLFAGLAVLVHWNLWSRRLRASTAAFAASAVAGLIELLQGPIPYRGADVWDLVAGAAGAMLVGAGIGLWARKDRLLSRPGVRR